MMNRVRDWLLIVLWVVAALLIGVALVVLTVIYPKSIALYEELGVQQFPLPTLVLVRASHFLISKWWVLAALLLLGYSGLALVRRTSGGRAWWERTVQGNRRLKVGVAVAAMGLGLIAMPLIVVAWFLPLVAIRQQLAGP